MAFNGALRSRGWRRHETARAQELSGKRCLQRLVDHMVGEMRTCHNKMLMLFGFGQCRNRWAKNFFEVLGPCCVKWMMLISRSAREEANVILSKYSGYCCGLRPREPETSQGSAQAEPET